MGVFGGSVRWECSVEVFGGSVRWKCSRRYWRLTQILGGSVRWECSVEVFGGSVRWKFSRRYWRLTQILGESVRWKCSVGVFGGSVRWKCSVGVLSQILENNADLGWKFSRRFLNFIQGKSYYLHKYYDSATYRLTNQKDLGNL